MVCSRIRLITRPCLFLFDGTEVSIALVSRSFLGNALNPTMGKLGNAPATTEADMSRFPCLAEQATFSLHGDIWHPQTYDPVRKLCILPVS